MKLLRPLHYLLAFTLITGLILAACKKDKSGSVNIVGSWVNTMNPNDGNPIRQEVFLFNSDKTVIMESSLINASTKTLMGYSSRMEGKYELFKDSIRFYQLNNYTYSQHPYYSPSRQDLKLTSSNIPAYTRALIFSTGNVSFHLGFDCPPFASCITPLEYTRQQPAL